MKKGMLIKEVKLHDETEILLDKIYPVMPINDIDYDVRYFIGDEEQHLFLGSYNCNKLVVSSKKFDSVQILLGEGYISELATEWRNLFVTDGIWQGGDGLFTFNLDNGCDRFDQKSLANTLMVFGDSFVGRFDPETQQRLQPHLMPNNSIAYLTKDMTLEFKVNKGPNQDVKAFYEVREDLNFKGPLPKNLVQYDQYEENEGYLSGYYPDAIELVFDLRKNRYITHIEFFNYFSKESKALAKRGFKDIKIFGSNDNKTYDLIKEVSLEMAHSMDFKQVVMISKSNRYIKIICHPENGVGNHNDKTYQEGLFGLNAVKFFDEQRQFRDIAVTANTFMQKEDLNAWIWLQDGVVIGDSLYFLPLTVCTDMTQPEGLQFKILGVSMFKTPIEDKQLNTDKTIQKTSPLYAYDGTSTYFFGAGIMPNTVQAGAANPDGYIYIYGYKTTMGLREMIVARVKEDDFEYFDEWTYFNGTEFTYNILESAPLLGHISCEMSVSPLLEGKYAGKYLAVFTYDVNTEYVAIALGDTPYGPFTNPQKVYRTLEHDIFQSTTYTYNAKAHPHLSKSKKVLVSYNTNTYDFDHNMSNRLIYGPRFIYLNEIEE